MLNSLKDFSIAYSFDQSGFKRHAKNFSPLNPAKFAGKHFLVTGGSRGIGAAVAKSLLNMGATVTVTARSREDFEMNFQSLSNINFVKLDLADFSAILSSRFSPFDGVVFNAGGMPETLTVVEGEFDTIFASQVVGHFILMNHLIDMGKLKTNAPVHWVSSGGMYLHKLSLEDLSWQRKPYNKVTSYANAKRAQVILNGLLAKRYKNFIFSCSHPGWVGTDSLTKALPQFTDLLGKRLRSPEQGADTILWCLEQGIQLKSGLFWFDRHARKTTPFFWTKESESDRLALLKLLEETHRVAFQSVSDNAEMSVN